MDSTEKRRYLYDAVKIGASLTLLFSTLRFAFTEGQKTAVRERDNYTCQYPGCNRVVKNSQQVHHITPQGYSKRLGELPGYSPMVPDVPHNAVSLCEYHHLGYEKGVHSEINLDEWNPLHPDMIFAYHYYRKSLDSLSPELIKMYPECYAHFKAAAIRHDKQVAGTKDAHKKRGDAFNYVLRSWRSGLLDDRQIYWNDEFDGDLHVLAIKSTIEAQRAGWEYPLRNIGRSGRKNRGTYIWDNIVTLKLERYVLKLKQHKLAKIYQKMKKGDVPSRIVYYEEIYVPAMKNFDVAVGAPEMIQYYLDTLDSEEYKALMLDIRMAKSNRNNSLSVLINKVFYPAKKLYGGSPPVKKIYR
jgi:hypothetical protein